VLLTLATNIANSMLFILSLFDEYLSHLYYLPNTVLGVRRIVSKTNKVPALFDFIS
jgi:hypothetical protein